MWKILQLCLVALCAGCSDSRRSEQPDVILVVVDTLRADHMSLYGYARQTTPAMDEFAKSGAVFEACQAASSWTLPSMAMLFSGAYDGRNSGQLDQPWPTLAEAFQGAGYRTSAVVANPILGSGEGDFGAGFRRGFGKYELVGKRFGLKPKQKAQTNGWYGDEVVKRGIRQLQAGTGDPQFVWLQMFDPHFPRQPQKAPDWDANPEPQVGDQLAADERAYIERELALYDAEVAGADAAFGKLIAWLEAEGRLENTIVVVTSDHGEGLWQRTLPEGEEPKKKNEVPRLYSDHGIMVSDEQVHVPLLIAGPGVPVGLRVQRMVSLVDLAPTLGRLSDLAVSGAPEVVAGMDLFEATGPRPVYSFCSRAGSVTVDNRWRLVLPSDARVKNYGDGLKFYDLAGDPGEQHSSLGDSSLGQPNVLVLEKQLRAFRALAVPEADELDAAEQAARRQLLDDLGYVDQ